MQSRTSFKTASLLVSDAMRPLLKTFPTTRSNDITWGLSVSGVLRLECDEDLRGVLVVALSVNDTRGEALVDRVERDFPLREDACWLIVDEIFVFSIKLIDEKEGNWISDWVWAKSTWFLFTNWARELFKVFECGLLKKVGIWGWFLIDKWEWLKEVNLDVFWWASDAFLVFTSLWDSICTGVVVNGRLCDAYLEWFGYLVTRVAKESSKECILVFWVPSKGLCQAGVNLLKDLRTRDARLEVVLLN